MGNIGKTYRQFFILVSVLFVISGCTNITHIDMSIESSKDLNQDKQKVSSPLMLTFYELRDAEKFSKLDFWALVDEPSDQLSGDLISQAKHVILPAEKQVYRIAFDPQARFLGVVGSFRSLDENGSWRYVQNLDVGSYNSLELVIDHSSIKEDDSW